MSTSTTLVVAFAAAVSMLMILACANGLRTMARCSIPGRVMLSVQRVRPVISRWSSLRRRSRPISRSGAGASWMAVMPCAPSARVAAVLSGVLHGLDDVVVARAAAEVALEAEPDLLLGGVRVLLEQVDALHDHPRRAEPALEAVALAERLLHRVQLAVGGQPLDRGDLGAVGLDGQHVARLHAAAVEVHRAGAAVAGVAADDGAGLAELLAQVLHQQHPGFDVVGDLLAVDGEADPRHGLSLVPRVATRSRVWCSSR